MSSVPKTIAEGIAAQIHHHLKLEYQRGWDAAMKYAQIDRKKMSDTKLRDEIYAKELNIKQDGWSKITYPKEELEDGLSG